MRNRRITRMPPKAGLPTPRPKVVRRKLSAVLPFENDLIDKIKPRCRKDCMDAPRPCPWVSCRYHLFLEVLSSGSLRHQFPSSEVWEMKETCALDLAEKGGMTLEQIGTYLNVTRERVRQIEKRALLKICRRFPSFLEAFGDF